MADRVILLDAGWRRSPAMMPGYVAGHAPRNKGMEYPPDPPRPEEIMLVMGQAGHDRHGLRIRARIAVLWRAGLRISEALALNETDLDLSRGSVLVHPGKGDTRRQAGMHRFGFAQLAAWQALRVLLPPGPLFCVIDGVTRGRRCTATGARGEMRDLAAAAGVRRRFAAHQLGHTDLGTTSTYLQDIDPSEIIDAAASRTAAREAAVNARHPTGDAAEVTASRRTQLSQLSSGRVTSHSVR